jgi:hypothetical protein
MMIPTAMKNVCTMYVLCFCSLTTRTYLNRR